MKDPYNEIAEMAVAGEDRYTTMIVRIRADGIEFNEILEFDGDTVSWCWLSDWYEGQKDVKYIGSIQLDDVDVTQKPRREYETVSE